MFKFMKLAFKGVFRNTRRTAITAFVLVFGTAALILAGGFAAFSFRGLRESTIHGQLGHIQLFTRQFLLREESRPLELGLDSVSGMKRRIAELELPASESQPWTGVSPKIRPC